MRTWRRSSKAEGRESAALPGLETVCRRFTLSWMGLAVYKRPFSFIKGREEGVAFRGRIDSGEIQALRLRQCLGVELSAADQHQLLDSLLTRPLLSANQRSVERCKGFGTVELQVLLMADHQVQPPWQWAAKRIPGLATHDDRLAQGHRLEVFEISRQVPRHLVIKSDHAVIGERRDHGKGKGGLIHGGENNRAPAGQSAPPETRQHHQTVIFALLKRQADVIDRLQANCSPSMETPAMARHSRPTLRHLLTACSLLLPIAAFAATPDASVAAKNGREEPHPLVIAHRGASGYVPEHTLAAYALAILQGADYVEPDLVMTRDGELVARHDNELGLTTDVSQHPEFADRKRTQMVDGVELTGWFSEDFTLAELKTLRAIERIPAIRPGNARMDGSLEIPTLQEIIDLVKTMQLSERRRIGLYPETKHPTHFQQLGLAMEKPLVRVLHRNGYAGRNAPVYIQSFEVENLKTLSRMTQLRLVQLFSSGQPYDQQVRGGKLTYAQMATAEGLKAISRYAAGVGPEKSYIIPRDANGNLGQPTDFVPNAHAAGTESASVHLPRRKRLSADQPAQG